MDLRVALAYVFIQTILTPSNHNRLWYKSWNMRRHNFYKSEIHVNSFDTHPQKRCEQEVVNKKTGY